MATYHCRTAATVATAAILRHLDASGIVAADHMIVIDGEYRLILREDEIAALEAHGIPVVRGEPLRTRDERSDVGTPDGGGVDM